MFTDWAAAEHGMADTLRALMSSGRLEPGRMRAQLTEIVSLFLDAGAAAGDLRSDADAGDVAAIMAGVLVVADAPASAGRHPAGTLTWLGVSVSSFTSGRSRRKVLMPPDSDATSSQPCWRRARSAR